VYPLVESWAPCRICGSELLRPLHVYKSRRKLSPEPFLALLGCERCGVAQSAPAPTQAMLDAYYTEPEGWEARTEEDDEKVARKLRSKHESYARQLELLQPHLNAAAAGRPPRALDFGCGLGAWLDVLQDAGFETYGIEPGAKQARVAARRHTLLDSVPAEERFDLVVLNHVLEHLLDPQATLRELAGSLRVGGQLFVSVPDLGRVHAHRDLAYVANDLHLNSFSAAGLASALGLGGFAVEQHFDTDEWSALEKGRPTRLRMLARREGEARFPAVEAPLEMAVVSLRELGRADSAEQAEAGSGPAAASAQNGGGNAEEQGAPPEAEPQAGREPGGDGAPEATGGRARRALRRIVGRG
jgi:SAM-dependent methyltransferase